jgi:uroporphyrinogen-III synthase
MTIWLTRPREQSEVFAKALGKPTCIAPVQYIEYRTPIITGLYDVILTTSQHACVGIQQFRDLVLYTVGEASAEAARKHGFHLAVALAQDAVGLAAMAAAAHDKPTRFLYLAGAETRIDIKALLEARGHNVTKIVSYEAVGEKHLAPELTEHWNAIRGGVFMSVGAVKAAQALITNDVSHIQAFCISATVAAAAGALPWQAIHVSASPTQQSLIDVINTTIKA